MTEVIDIADLLPSNKKRKLIAEDVEEFRAGSIMRIKLQDFMSYSLAEFQMSPNLNMIIGPNGTGKSTIVCAICIGLAGKPELLGKHMMNIGQFVNQGKGQAIIEIEIKGERANQSIVLRRRIVAETNKSIFYKNNVEVSERSVRELVRSFDIQLDNLCQFLAQDRVSKFAAQKPNELLREIERSFGDGELLRQHQALHDISCELKKQESERNDIDARLDAFTKQKETLSLEVEKFKSYQAKKRDLEMHQQLIPFVQIQDAKNEYTEAKRKRDELAKSLKEFKRLIRPVTESIDRFTNNSSTLQTKMDELTETMNHADKEIDNGSKKCKIYDDKIEQLNYELRRKLTGIVKKSQKLEEAKKEVEHWEHDIKRLTESLATEEEIQNQINERNELSENINDKRREAQEQAQKMDYLQRRATRHENNIKDFRRRLSSNDKLNILNTSDPYSQYRKVYQAVQYLRNHQEEFAGTYYEPAVVSLTVRKGYGVILSNIVSIDAQLAIITTSEQNHKFVTKKIMDGLKINISFRQIGTHFQINERDRLSKDELNELGFEGYLTDFIEGPAPVIQMLCEQHMIHLIPVASRGLSSDQLTALEKFPKIASFVAGDQIHRRFRSNYGSRNQYTTATFLRPSYRLFDGDGLSQDAKLELEKKAEEENGHLSNVNNEIEELRTKTGEFSKELSVLQNEHARITGELKKKQETRRSLAKAKSRLESLNEVVEKLEQEIASISSENHIDLKKQTFDKISEFFNKKLQTIDKMVELHATSQETREQLAIVSFELFQERNRQISLKSLLEEFSREERHKTAAFEEMKKRCQDMRSETAATIKRLNAEVSTKLTDEDREIIAALTSSYRDAGQFTSEAINAKIEQIRRDLHNFSDAEESALAKYTRVEAGISDLQERRPDLETKCIELADSINLLQKKWLPALESLIQKISDNFDAMFSKMYPAGKVELYRDPDSYIDWRLDILVQFREGENLSPLDGTTQSGGERSVSTAIFLNSLQGLVNAPFRVVDEINQGMDARNERMIHKLIVETACSNTNNSQYFLITPKLLTDLTYHPKMSVHCIMAGKFCPDPNIDQSLLKLGIAARYV